jgi:hypothetical protein
MKYATLAMLTAVASLTAVSLRAAELPGAGEDSFAAAAVVSDQELATKRARGDDGDGKGGDGGNGNGGTGGNGAAMSCVQCSADGTSNIAGRAFQNAVGVFTVVQNTGNQVFLNTVTVVNVSIGR